MSTSKKASYHYISHSVEDTYIFAKKIASVLGSSDVIVLQGDLGAGKTTFVQGLAHALGVSPKEYVCSPTFVLAKEYTTTKIPLYHLDVYRLDHANELMSLGIQEYLQGDGVCLIEWGDKILDFLTQHYMRIQILVASEHSRTFCLYPPRPTLSRMDK